MGMGQFSHSRHSSKLQSAANDSDHSDPPAVGRGALTSVRLLAAPLLEAGVPAPWVHIAIRLMHAAGATWWRRCGRRWRATADIQQFVGVSDPEIRDGSVDR